MATELKSLSDLGGSETGSPAAPVHVQKLDAQDPTVATLVTQAEIARQLQASEEVAARGVPTPLERIELLQDWVDGLAELRNGRVAER